MPFSPEDLDALTDAVSTLENPGLAVQITNVVGMPVEYALSRLPRDVSRRIGEAITTTIGPIVLLVIAPPPNSPPVVLHPLRLRLRSSNTTDFLRKAYLLPNPCSHNLWY